MGANLTSAPRTTGRVYSLIQRLSVADFTGVLAIPLASTTSFFSTLPGIMTIPFAKNQAARLLSAMAGIADAGSTGKLRLENAQINVILGPNANLRRAFACPVSGAILGNAGVNFGMSDDEYILGQDYAEIGMAGGAPLGVSVTGTVTNTDGAAAHNLNFTVAALWEIYAVSG